MNSKNTISFAIAATAIAVLVSAGSVKAQDPGSDPDLDVTYASGAPKYSAKITKFTVSWDQFVFMSFWYSPTLHIVTAEGKASWNTSVGSGWGDLYGFHWNGRDLLKTTSSRVSPYIANLSGGQSTFNNAFSFRITAWNDNTAEPKAMDLRRLDHP